MSDRIEQVEEISLRDAQARNYDDAFVRTRGAFGRVAQVRALMHHIAPRRGESILDAGCGTGIYTVEMAAHGASVFAVDFSAASIDVLQGKLASLGLGGVRTAVGDLALVELPDGAFDSAISFEVIQHIPTHAKRVAALKNIHAALKPGGRFLMLVYRYGGWIKAPAPKEELNHGGNGLYRIAFTEEDCRRLFADAGFTVDRVRGILNVPRRLRRRLPTWAAPIETWLSMLPVSASIGDYLLIEGRSI